MCVLGASAQSVTLTGTLAGAGGLPAKNGTLTFLPSQVFFVAGTAVVVNSAQCATDAFGSVVEMGNPLTVARVAAQFTGTLAPGNYYVKYSWYDLAGNMTAASPETVRQLPSTGELQILPPVGSVPANAVGMNVYISSTPGTETLQGQTVTPTGQFTQSTALVNGAAPPTTNNTICKVIANDVGWPTGTGYNVSLVDASGNTLFSYPEMWQFYGSGSVYNLAQGIPYYHGQVTYPVPVLTIPYNHNVQSISGPINMTGFNLVNIGEIGVGTALPAWGIDVEGTGLASIINANGGYLVNGSGGTTGVCLGSDGTAYDVPIVCLTSVTQHYQTVAINGSALPQEPETNFSSNFTGADNAGIATNLDLSNTGVAAATYTNATVQVDVKGRVLSASSGPVSQVLASVTFTGCMLAPDGGSVWDCSATQSIGSTLANNTYKISCQMTQGTYTITNLSTAAFYISAKSTTSFSYSIAADHSGANGFQPVVDCIITN